MTFCHIILSRSLLLSFIMPLITPSHSSKAFVSGTSFLSTASAVLIRNNINSHFPDSSKHAPPFLTSFPRTFSPIPWLLIIHNYSTSPTSVQTIHFSHSLFPLCCTLLSQLPLPSALNSSLSALQVHWERLLVSLLSRLPLFLSSRKLECYFGTWISGINITFLNISFSQWSPCDYSVCLQEESLQEGYMSCLSFSFSNLLKSRHSGWKCKTFLSHAVILRKLMNQDTVKHTQTITKLTECWERENFSVA